MLFTAILFLCYGGCSLYFNAYVHNLNDEAVTMLFVVSRRGICTAAVSVFVKEALVTGDKRLASSNTGEVLCAHEQIQMAVSTFWTS